MDFHTNHNRNPKLPLSNPANSNINNTDRVSRNVEDVVMQTSSEDSLEELEPMINSVTCGPPALVTHRTNSVNTAAL